MARFSSNVSVTLMQGLDEHRETFTPEPGEPVFVLDTRKVYIGDGVTPGGIEWPGFDGRYPSLEWVKGADGKRFLRLLADGVPVRPGASDEDTL